MTPAGRLRALRRSPSLACSEPMALTGELKDHAVVDEPVYDDAGGHWVGEHLGPVRKGQVRRYSDACAFITLCDDLVKQISSLSLKWNVSQFVDQN